MAVSKITDVDRLLRGISTDHPETVRDAWRALLSAGKPATLKVLDTLATPGWAEYPKGPFAQYLGVLLSVLDELDPVAFRREIKRLPVSKLHPLHRMTVDLMARRRGERPRGTLAQGCKIYISDEVTGGEQIIRWLSEWSRTEGIELSGLHRIDVVALHPQLRYLGLYRVYYSGMVLTWPVNSHRGVRKWYHKLNMEYTFYHEVGHHAWGHLEGGRDEDQESEANDFARARLRKSRPITTGIGRVLMVPFAPLVRMLLNKTKSGRRSLRENTALSSDPDIPL